MAHAVVNAALSLAKGESALAGASSAVTAEAVGLISQAYYGKNASELTDEQKQKISALASLAVGLAGGLVGGDTASAVSGAQTGKVTVENNALSDNKPGHDEVELEKEHGNLPLKIHKINPLQIGQVDDEGNTLLAGGKVKWPVKEANAGKGTTGTTSAGQTGYAATKPIVNPATNTVVTDHIIVPSGKAPKTSTPNSVYEVSRADGTKSITYYDDKGRIFSREDYGQQRTHGELGYDSNGKVPPHEHKTTYNDRGFKDKSYYREIDANGKAVGPWILEK